MSSISSRSLSMSSLIFFPFLASSGFALPPSPPSDGFVGRVSFFFCSAISPSIGTGPWSLHHERVYPGILACRSHAIGQPGPEGHVGAPCRSARAAKLLAQREGLVLVRRSQTGAIHAL